LASGTWTVTCLSSPGVPLQFNNITVGGGLTVNFNTGGSASTTYNFFGTISSNGSALTFSPGTFNIGGGINNSGGGDTITFGAGTFNLGTMGATTCNGATNVSICQNGTAVIFGGPSTFVMAGGIYNKGGGTLTMGSGTTNSFNIGKDGNGNSFVGAGGAKTTFGDATGAGDVFETSGNLNVAGGGGSCLTLPAATQHDIDGFFTSAGGTILGSGTYTVADYFALGPSGGGDVTCSGTAVGMSGTNVTLVIGGHVIPASGSNSGDSFYMGAGYSNVTLLAPTTGALANLAVVGPQSGTAGAVLAEGASGADFSGAFYFPTSPISMSGGSSLGSFGANQCLMLIGSQVTLTGGAALASSCTGLGGSNSSNVVLIQ
jgi:hypothetical protein